MPTHTSTSRRHVIGTGLRLTGGALGAAALPACGMFGQGAQQSVGPKQLRSGVTVTWRTYIINVDQSEQVNQLWAAKYPEVKIVYEHLAFAQHMDKLIAEMVAGGTPEVALVLYPNVAKLQPQLTNLTSYMRRDRFPEREFFPASLDHYRYRGQSFAMPYDFPVRPVWYNATMFRERGIKHPPVGWDEPGWTWNDVMDTARRLTRIDAGRPEDTIWGWGWGQGVGVPGLNEVVMFTANNSAALFSPDGKEILLTQPGAVETLQFMQDLIQRWRVARARADVQAVPGDRFLAGKLAMDLFRPVVLANYRKNLPFEFAMAPLPRGPRAKARASSMTGSAWVQPEANKNQEEAWALMQHLVSAEVERAQIQHVGIMPARRQVMEEYASEEPPRNMKILIRAAETAVLIPPTPWYTDTQNALTPLLNELWDGAKSTTVVAQEAKRQIDPILQQPYQFKTS